MKISLIAAIAANGVIGGKTSPTQNGMPWHLPEDLGRFKN